MKEEKKEVTSSRYAWALGIVAVFLAAGFFYAVSGSRNDSEEVAEADPVEQAAPVIAVKNVGPNDFAAFVVNNGATVIDVHTPEQDHITDQDLFIPYESIATDPLLPTDKNAPIALYCQSGNMSAIAAEELISLGYTNVANLSGGKEAWDEFVVQQNAARAAALEAAEATDSAEATDVVTE